MLATGSAIPVRSLIAQRFAKASVGGQAATAMNAIDRYVSFDTNGVCKRTVS
jgi:hypothetical protein